ncbi:MAG: transglutaminase-like cysteine peptidase [Poseidonibacter sp.]|uniref:transglutaminase-like cysteine peptidase n=1 Tax=Poseidonibacter sp. TaxID=2321188 RepID=UPI00359D9019
MKRNKLFIPFYLYLLLNTSSFAISVKNIAIEEVNDIHKKYGFNAKKRVLLWDEMIESSKDKDILIKLKNVNNFFNQIHYIVDLEHWRKEDYSASLLEFLGTGAGDSEDYAIAKYISLVKLGIPKHKLKIIFVKDISENPKDDHEHILLAYYHNKNSNPIMLDSIHKELSLAKKRDDIYPIYKDEFTNNFSNKAIWNKEVLKTMNMTQAINNNTTNLFIE